MVLDMGSYGDDIRTCGLACEDFAQLLVPGAASLHITPPQEAAQLPAAAAAALRRHVPDFPDREAATVAWLPERTRPVAQVPELDNVIAQPVELGDDADR